LSRRRNSRRRMSKRRKSKRRMSRRRSSSRRRMSRRRSSSRRRMSRRRSSSHRRMSRRRSSTRRRSEKTDYKTLENQAGKYFVDEGTETESEEEEKKEEPEKTEKEKKQEPKKNKKPKKTKQNKPKKTDQEKKEINKKKCKYVGVDRNERTLTKDDLYERATSLCIDCTELKKKKYCRRPCEWLGKNKGGCVGTKIKKRSKSKTRIQKENLDVKKEEITEFVKNQIEQKVKTSEIEKI